MKRDASFPASLFIGSALKAPTVDQPPTRARAVSATRPAPTARVLVKTPHEGVPIARPIDSNADNRKGQAKDVVGLGAGIFLKERHPASEVVVRRGYYASLPSES